MVDDASQRGARLLGGRAFRARKLAGQFVPPQRPAKGEPFEALYEEEMAQLVAQLDDTAAVRVAVGIGDAAVESPTAAPSTVGAA